MSKPAEALPGLFMLIGLGSALTGIALYSIPIALIVGGTVCFVAGGLATRRPS